MDTKTKYKEYVNTSFVKAVEPLVIDKASAATYTDDEGKSYIDCFSGISTVNAGHCNPEIVEAAKAQMDRLVHCCSYVYHVKPVADLAEKIAQITPGKLKKSFFANSGAESIEGAMRLAKQFTGRYEMVGLYGSFHGRSNATLSVTGNYGRKRGGGPFLTGVMFTPAPYCYRCPFKQKGPDSCNMLCAEFLEEIIRAHSTYNVAFLIAEPILGEGGIIVPPLDYFKVIKQILDHHKILLIADEVQSGFCRTGKMFAIEHYGIEPDIMCLAKGIASGFPLSCFIARQEIADAFKPGDHLTTFGGNPVSCAASLANIAFLEKNNIAEKSAQKGEGLMESLKKIKPKNVGIGEIRGKGLMVGVEVVKDNNSKEPAAAEAGKIRAACREKGVLIGVGGQFANILRIQPPLVISDEELAKTVDVLKEVMES
jgi:4-aminobutyrate aminotransferase